MKRELEKKGFKVKILKMPNTSKPKIGEWVNYLKKSVGKLDDETYFVAHSMGCQTVMRFLEKENYNGKVGKAIFVAGWFKLDNLEDEEVEAIASPWTNIKIDFKKVKQKLSNLTVFLSSNEPYGFVEYNEKTFREKLDAKVILEKKGHFREDDGVKELPEVLREIQNNAEVNCIIIHGCPSRNENDPKKRTYDKHWIPWIKKELYLQGIKTDTPIMPKPWEPDYNAFKNEFEKNKITENTILIGHSCGCAFLVRWLGETKQKINKLILVAPWKIPDKDDKFRKAFYEYPTDKAIKSRVKEIIMFTADDEEDNGKKSLKIFHEALGGKVIELKGRGHYTMGDMGTEEFPELLKEVIKGKYF